MGFEDLTIELNVLDGVISQTDREARCRGTDWVVPCYNTSFVADRRASDGTLYAGLKSRKPENRQTKACLSALSKFRGVEG